MSASFVWGIDDIKKINSLDVEKVREDRSRLIIMEGHGSVIQHLPTVESPFATQQHALKITEKEYPDPWRQPRPKKLTVPIPSGATALSKDTEDSEVYTVPRQQRGALLFTDVVNSMRTEAPAEEE